MGMKLFLAVKDVNIQLLDINEWWLIGYKIESFRDELPFV